MITSTTKGAGEWLIFSSVCMVCFSDIYHSVLLDSCISKLQHISSDRQNIPSNIPSARAPQDLPCSCIWVHFTPWPFHWEEHYWNTDCHLWDGLVFLFLHPREQKETIRWSFIGFPGIYLSPFVFEFSTMFNSEIGENVIDFLELFHRLMTKKVQVFWVGKTWVIKTWKVMNQRKQARILLSKLYIVVHSVFRKLWGV